MCSTANTEWFHYWFDSPYYHMLYRHRDEHEAALFLGKLMKHLQLQPGINLLDLGCGKGRHSLFLNSIGYRVTGVDLSKENIRHAQAFENESLRFEIQDMRELKLSQRFECILNLFTSFGYFSEDADNLRVLHEVKNHLTEGGVFVIDYFNTNNIVKQGVCNFECTIDGVEFSIRKHIEVKRVVKEIAIADGDKKYYFEEQVQLLNATMLHALLNEAGLKPTGTSGSYHLEPFDAEHSERLIIIARNV
ncbi:MAG: SAM-dependent methyltransferase [Flavobacteriales bacterium]